MTLFAVLTILSILPFSSAQNPGNGPSFRLRIDQLTIGDLSIWCIFDLVYIVLSVLCILPIVRRKLHRIPFIALFSALFCNVVHNSLQVAYVVTGQNVDGPGFFNFEKASVLQAALLFFGNWASPLLFLSLVLLLLDRHMCRISVLRRAEVYAFCALFGWFALLFATATTASGLNAVLTAERKRLRELQGRASLGDIRKMFNAQLRYQKCHYVLVAFWSFTAACLTGLTAYVYILGKLDGVHDKISELMFFVVTPLYFLGILEGIAFTVLTSPRVHFSPVGYERLGLANDIISNSLESAVSAVVVVLGLKRAYWQSAQGSQWLGLVNQA